MKKILFLLLLTWSVLSFAGQTRYRVELAYLKDADQKMSIEDLSALDFSPKANPVGMGFQKGSDWKRVRLVPDPDGPLLVNLDKDDHLILVVGPYSLDYLNFFTLVNGQWQEQQGGTKQSKNLKNCPVDLHCFKVPELKGESASYFLKIRTSGSNAARLDVMTAEQMQDMSVERSIRITVSLTLSIALLLVALVYLVFERTRLIFVFTLFQASLVMSAGASTGVFSVLNAWMQLDILNDMRNLTLILRTAMSVMLGWAVLAAHKPSVVYVKATYALLIVCFASICLLQSQYEWLVYWLVLTVMLVSPLVNIWGTMQVQIDLPGKRILQASWSLYFVVICVGTANSFGLFNFQDEIGIIQHYRDMRLNGLVFFTIVVTMTIIHKKSNLRWQALQASQKQELAAEKERLEQLQLKDQMALIDMLTHELKTPLSTIKFAISSLKRTALALGESMARIQNIDASVRRMDALIEHVAMSNQIERHEVSTDLKMISAADLMHEVLQEYPAMDRFDVDIEDGATFHAPPLFLNLIVENLVANAFKYASDGHVRIKIVQDPELWTGFQISNRVSEDTQPDEDRLFERYYRHPLFQNLPGMGIGLSLVHLAAKKTGATVHYQRQGQEVTFEVRFPL